MKEFLTQWIQVTYLQIKQPENRVMTTHNPIPKESCRAGRESSCLPGLSPDILQKTKFPVCQPQWCLYCHMWGEKVRSMHGNKH